MAVSELYGHIQKDRAPQGRGACCTTKKSPSAALVAGRMGQVNMSQSQRVSILLEVRRAP